MLYLEDGISFLLIIEGYCVFFISVGALYYIAVPGFDLINLFGNEVLGYYTCSLDETYYLLILFSLLLLLLSLLLFV